MYLRENLKKNRLLQMLASLKLTVTCLILLFILTMWGTIAQVQSGLYLAQEKFFYSFFFLIWDFLPFPGAQLVMWVLFVNLFCVALVGYIYTWKKIGILIIHFGLLLFLAAGFVAFHGSVDSYLTLKEGQSMNVSTAFHTWEVSVWEQTVNEKMENFQRNITAVDITDFHKSQIIDFKEQKLTVSLQEYCRNCAAYASGGKQKVLNASGIQRLEAVGLEKEPEKNNPGAIFHVKTYRGQDFEILLYGSEQKPTYIINEGRRFNFILRLKRYSLPFTIKLVDFMMERHPGTDMPRSFKSRVAVETNGAWREKVISMNNPLRYKNYTFYQSSYMIDRFQNEMSTLAVVKNSGRILPYIATGITFAGLVIHFVMMGIFSRKSIKKEEK